MRPVSSAILDVVVLAAMLAAIYSVFMYVPTERQMGVVQRIFYFHVPAAMTAFLAFAIVFGASIHYLRTSEERSDMIAQVAAELGVLFGLIVLVTGPLWAKPVWGVFWRWEPRLTSMLVTLAMYVAYLMVRSYSTASESGTRRVAAVLGVIAFANVPFVYYSVHLWAPEQQLHPRSVELAPEMVRARYLCTAAFAALFLYLLKRGLEQEKIARRIDRLRQKRHSRESVAAPQM